MKFAVAAAAMLSAVAIAAPVKEEDCEEEVKVVKTYGTEHKPVVYEPVHKPADYSKPAPTYPVHKDGDNKDCPVCPVVPDNGGECPTPEPILSPIAYPIRFTSSWRVEAFPDQVVSMMNEPTGGLEGARGIYEFGINSDIDLICYNITLIDVTGDYQSPADTATHIHNSELGMSGPPRIAFPNPVIVEGSNIRSSYGCLQAPFVTGLTGADNVTDTGSASGFTLADIEANPSAYNADVHTTDAVPGAVRGQFEAPLVF